MLLVQTVTVVLELDKGVTKEVQSEELREIELIVLISIPLLVLVTSVSGFGLCCFMLSVSSLYYLQSGSMAKH